MPLSRAKFLAALLTKLPTKLLGDALIAVTVALASGALFNLLRPTPLPWVAKRAPELHVPCPEERGEAAAASPTEPLLRRPEEGTLLIDARSAEEFSRWHLPEAKNLPYDFLEPIDQEQLRALGAFGARQLFVYGDGGDPDSGRALADELAGKGLRNVRYVEGGAPALEEHP